MKKGISENDKRAQTGRSASVRSGVNKPNFTSAATRQDVINLREVDDEDDDQYDQDQMDMMEDLNSQQINVKSFQLNVPSSGGAQDKGSKSMMVQKNRNTTAIGSGIGGGIKSGIGGGIGSGIGGGLKRPTVVKPRAEVTNTTSNYAASNGINGHGISGSKV